MNNNFKKVPLNSSFIEQLERLYTLYVIYLPDIRLWTSTAASTAVFISASLV
jgi:hypothetical protein